MLVDIGTLPRRDPHLARFESWIETKLAPLPRSIEHPVRQFVTWHHLKRIRAKCANGAPARGPVHAAKQEITETIKFLSWLSDEHQRSAATCTQLDIDAWLASGTTTRSTIRTFFVFARDTRINAVVTVPHRCARRAPSLTQQQRLAWLEEMLSGNSESLSYRTAGVLLLLYAQPLVRIARLRLDDVHIDGDQTTIRLAANSTPVPAPFADLLRQHQANRPHLRTGAPQSPWLFPSTRAGQHLHPNTIMIHLRGLGIDLLGARNRAIADLVSAVPAPLIADALGYSHTVTHKHAAAAGAPWERYLSNRLPERP